MSRTLIWCTMSVPAGLLNDNHCGGVAGSNGQRVRLLHESTVIA